MNGLCTRGSWILSVMLVPLSAWSTASNDQVWTVFGFRDPKGPAIADQAVELRNLLAQQMGSDGWVLSERETKTRLGAHGLSVVDIAAVIARVNEAESDYQQFELDAARSKAQAALQELVKMGGEIGVWEAAQTAHLLLGMGHLARSTRDTASARAEFEAILRVAPSFQPQGHDPMVLALFKKAHDSVSHEQTGDLIVSCLGSCPNGFIWIDAAPNGRVNGAAVKLPVGSYRVRITDREDRPRLRSFTHEVQIRAGVETKITIDLDSEGALASIEEGPTFDVPNDPDRRMRIIQAVSANRVGRSVFLWIDGGSLHAAVIDPSYPQIIRRHAMATIPSEGQFRAPCLELARFVAGNELPVPPKVISLAPSLAALPPAVEAKTEGVPVLTVVKWSGVGLTAVLGVVTSAYTINRSIAGDNSETADHWRNGLVISTAIVAVASAAILVIVEYLQSRSATQSGEGLELKAPKLPDSPKLPTSPKLPDAPKLPSAPSLSLAVGPTGLTLQF
jgi:hypothetical protein